VASSAAPSEQGDSAAPLNDDSDNGVLGGNVNRLIQG
jgi:hypothetical protein